VIENSQGVRELASQRKKAKNVLNKLTAATQARESLVRALAVDANVRVLAARACGVVGAGGGQGGGAGGGGGRGAAEHGRGGSGGRVCFACAGGVLSSRVSRLFPPTRSSPPKSCGMRHLPPPYPLPPQKPPPPPPPLSPVFHL
jgi:hypothetical protein